MLGRNRDRLAEAKRIGFERARLRRPPLALVGDQDRGLAGAAHQIGEGVVDRRRPDARIDQEEDRVGGGKRRGGLRLHAAREAFRRRLLEAGGVDHGEGEIAERRAALAAVAGDARPIVDQRQAACRPAD